jgi:heat shock protein HtpX
MSAIGLYTHIRNNRVKSVLLMAGFPVLLGGVWYALCLIWTALQLGLAGVTEAASLDAAVLHYAALALPKALATWWMPLVAATAWVTLAYCWQDRLVRLATRAKPLDRDRHRNLVDLVENLAIGAGLPAPRIEIVETGALNAYATGLSPNTATIGVTRGLLQRLTRPELEAVLAHEMTHIKNGDGQLTLIAGLFAGGLSFLGDVGSRIVSLARPSDAPGVVDMESSSFDFLTDPSAGANEAPVGTGGLLLMVTFAVTAASVIVSILLLGFVRLFAMLTQLAISRSREYLADAGAVELTQNPDAMISALRKISGHADMPWVPRLLQPMMIGGDADDGWFDGLFATHPSIEDRISRLVRFAGGREYAPMTALKAAGETGFAAEINGAASEIPATATNFGRRRTLFRRVPRAA